MRSISSYSSKILVTAILIGGVQAGVQAADADPQTAQFYKQTCGICHGDKGQGVPALAPALKGNKFLTTADVKEIAATINKGRAGDQKRYKEFASPMPANPVNGKKLDALINYLRTTLQQGS